MSDNARWNLTDRAEAKLKPDSEKSTKQHVSDKFKGKADSAASSAQPESEKSYTQKMGDKFSTGSNDHNDRSFTQRTKETFGMGDRH